MTNDRLDAIIRKLDEHAERSGSTLSFTIGGRRLLLITDEQADRMRIMTPVADVGVVSSEASLRMLQANFDTALDARYAIALDKVWSAFIHPLATLTEDELLSGISQVATLAATYGTTYSSGALVFQGGDSADMYEQQHKERGSADRPRQRTTQIGPCSCGAESARRCVEKPQDEYSRASGAV